MKLTFSDSPNIDALTFKRLLLTGNELVFVERPSIQLAESYGTVGVLSQLRNLKKLFEGSSVTVIVDEPPNSVHNSIFYKKYFEKDLHSSEFLDIIFKGIENNWIHDSHFDKKHTEVHPEFSDFRTWILKNREEIKALDIANVKMPEQPFQITNKNEAYFAFKIICAEQSLRVTSVIHVSNKYDSSPICINPYLNKLIELRLTNDIYLGREAKSRQLGLKIMDCIIPDEALTQIPIQEILEFRENTKVLYENWIIEINKLEALLFKDKFAISKSDAEALFDSEINPRLKELRNEIRRIKDERFKNILKTIKNSAISFITLGTLSSFSIAGAILGFIGANLKTPQLTDEIIDAQFNLKDKQLSNGLTYLLKIQQLGNK